MRKHQQEEKFSEDPRENLHIENQLLKLKMQAEDGALFGSGFANIPPEIENEFLKHVQALEAAWKDAKKVKIYSYIGKPSFEKEHFLNDDAIEAALKTLLDTMQEQTIELSILGEYAPRLIYKFITEELFEHEIEDVRFPGMVTSFIYEEFYPNHTIGIEETAKSFLNEWFQKHLDEYSWELNDVMVLPDGVTMPLEKLLRKIKYIFDACISFTNCMYLLENISFHFDEEGKGLGFAEGVVNFEMIIEGGEKMGMKGPFKFFMNYEDKLWQIFYFIFPGFNWNENEACEI